MLSTKKGNALINNISPFLRLPYERMVIFQFQFVTRCNKILVRPCRFSWNHGLNCDVIHKIRPKRIYNIYHKTCFS